MLSTWGGHYAAGRMRSAYKRQALDGREDSLMVTAAAPRLAHGQGTLSGFLRPAGAGAASAAAAVPGTGPACPRGFQLPDEQLGAPACKGGGPQEGSRQLVACGGWTGQPGGPAAACLASSSGPVAQTGGGTDPSFNPTHDKVKGHVGAAAGTGRQATLDGCFAAHGPGTTAATAPEQRIGSGSGIRGGTREEGAPGNSPLAARDTNALALGVFAGEGDRAASTASALAKQPGCQGDRLSSTALDAGVFASDGDAVVCAALLPPALAKRPLCQGKKPGSELPNSNAKRLRAD